MEFAFIDFRDSAAGRQACIQGSSLAVWEVMMLARDYKNKAAAVADHLQWPELKVQAAFNYARAFPDEIETAVAENDAMDFEALRARCPRRRNSCRNPAAKSVDMLRFSWMSMSRPRSPQAAPTEPAITVRGLPHWEDGRFLGLPDMLLLQAAATDEV